MRDKAKPKNTTQLVFISHITEERAVALVLQRYLEEAFGSTIAVFVSSDRHSIGGGRPWFDHITQSLQKARVLLVLLSADSTKREWINYEAGFGRGTGATVIPIAIRDFTFSRLPFPLAGLQGRLIADIEGILFDTSETLGVTSPKLDTIEFRDDIRRAEASVTYKNLVMVPQLSSDQAMLSFEISNEGNTDLDLLLIEIIVPKQILHHEMHRIGRLRYLTEGTTTIDGTEYISYAYTTKSQHLGERVFPLRDVLTPSMGKLSLSALDIPLDMRHPAKLSKAKVYYQAHVRNYSTFRESVLLGDLLTPHSGA